MPKQAFEEDNSKEIATYILPDKELFLESEYK
jgi:hypothetical protein